MSSNAQSIYKIMSRADWTAFEASGAYEGSVDDMHDRFIHFSSLEQVEGTLAKHFAGQGALMLLAVDAASLGDALKWETSRDGELFPHLYGPLPLIAVNEAQRLPLGPDGQHRLPETMSR